MQLIHKKEIMVLQRNDSAIEAILSKVSSLIEEKELVFSHLVVDNKEIYENHEAYIQERIKEIERIEIITFTAKEMIWETLQSVEEYLKRAIPALQQIVDESYNNFTEETWKEIGQLTEGLEWLLQFKTFTQSSKEQPVHWEEFVTTFEECEEHFAPMLEAIEAEDTVLISDILAYEITPAFEQLAESVAKMLQDNNYLKDMN